LTQPSKLFDLWRRLYDRFAIEPRPALGGDEGPSISTLIQPVTDADALLRDPELQTSRVLQTTSAVIYYTVPADERWHWFGYHALRAAGDRDITSIDIADLAISMRIEVFAAVGERASFFAKELRLESGWTIRLDGSGGTTDGNWDLDVYLEVEQLRR